MNTIPSRDDRIVALAQAGIPYGEIGAFYGMTRQRVHQIARGAGISRNPNKGPKHQHGMAESKQS